MAGVRFLFGECVLDDARLELTGPTGSIHVEPQVFGLLLHLVRHADRVVTKEELLDEVWGDRFVSDSALTSRVKAARRAVGDDGTAQRVIRTVHGRGYQLVAEVRTEGDDRPAAPAPGRPELPRPRTAVIGRDVDVAEVVERVRTSPLVTITGPGGMGKTTLALVAASEVAEEHADGVVFVDLASIAPSADLTRVVAGAAGIEGDAGATLDGLVRHLADRALLIVLDNCEHVLAAAGDLVARLLAVGGGPRVLATSREPLGVLGEHVWPLGSLDAAAPTLFVERARAAEPRLEWDATDPEVVEVCRRLDGVPLALELAAGQLRRFELVDLLARLGEAPSLLTRAAGGAPRHATMDATIDWGYRLLDADEQALLRQLGTFPAEFDLQAVERSAPGLRSSPAAVLGQLVDKSLVVRQVGTGRYRLLETIRAFAIARLDELGDTAGAFERHRLAVLGRITATTRLDRWMSGTLASAYRTHLDDARQAFRASLDAGHAEDAVEIAVGASFLWRNAIGCVEGQRWVAELAQQPLEPDDQLWCRILEADVGQGRGDAGQMFTAAAAAEQLGAHSSDRVGVCIALHYASLAHITNLEECERRLCHALELASPLADRRVDNLLDVFRTVARMVAGEYDEARSIAVDLDRRASTDGYDCYLTNWAGWLVALAERDAATARRWIQQQHDYLARTGFENWLVAISTSLCDVIDGGDHRARTAATLALADREGYDAAGDCVLVLAYAELFADRFEAAAELVGTALRAGINSTVSYVLLAGAIDRPMRQELDAGTIDAAMQRGAQLDAAAVLAEALA